MNIHSMSDEDKRIVESRGFLLLGAYRQGEYVELREYVRELMANEYGLELLLNAIVAAGPEFTRDNIERWIDATNDYSTDDRKVVALCNGPEQLIASPNLDDVTLPDPLAGYRFAGLSSEL